MNASLLKNCPNSHSDASFGLSRAFGPELWIPHHVRSRRLSAGSIPNACAAVRPYPYGSDNSVNGCRQGEKRVLYLFHYRQTLSTGWYLAQVMLST